MKLLLKIDKNKKIGIKRKIVNEKEIIQCFLAVINSYVVYKIFGWEEFKRFDKEGFTYEAMGKENAIKLRNARKEFFKSLNL
jgi:hypothetical protein